MGLVLFSPDEQYIDVVDTTDPDLRETEARELSGNDPILLQQGVADPVGTLVRQLLGKVRTGKRPIGFLSIHGHGLPGIQSIAGGVPRRAKTLASVMATITPRSRNVIATQNIATIAPTLRLLTGNFTRNGSVWLMGCYVGQGSSGWCLIKALATIWRVPVTAGTQLQFGGDLQTRTLEGPTVTAKP